MAGRGSADRPTTPAGTYKSSTYVFWSSQCSEHEGLCSVVVGRGRSCLGKWFVLCLFLEFTLNNQGYSSFFHDKMLTFI